jgi:hypothetical protein
MWDPGCEVVAEEEAFYGSYGFVQQLREVLGDEWDYNKDDWYDSCDLKWVEYGLLACEYL